MELCIVPFNLPLPHNQYVLHQAVLVLAKDFLSEDVPRMGKSCNDYTYYKTVRPTLTFLPPLSKKDVTIKVVNFTLLKPA